MCPLSREFCGFFSLFHVHPFPRFVFTLWAAVFSLFLTLWIALRLFKDCLLSKSQNSSLVVLLITVATPVKLFSFAVNNDDANLACGADLEIILYFFLQFFSPCYSHVHFRK